MKKIVVIGHMDWAGNDMIGAVVKARNIYAQLVDEFGNDQVGNVDIYNWKNRKVRTLLSIAMAFKENRNVVLVCSDTSIALMKLFLILKKMFSNIIYYCVVGGDIVEILQRNPERLLTLGCIDNFYVETEDCVTGLEALGIKNAYLMRNFKCISAIDRIKPYNDKTIRFCTFSRVTKQKGIGEAILAVEQLNQEVPNVSCELDVYGTVDPEYKDEFEYLLKTNLHSHYRGIADSNSSVDILKNYYCLLFPTKYQSEGIPGTIIDGFAAALPVICSDWPRCRQIVSDCVDGIVFPFGDAMALKNSMKYAIQNPEVVEHLRIGALASFKKYQPEIAIAPLVKAIRQAKK